MSPFWQNLDLLPSMVREKAKEKPKRSAKEYAEGREKFQEGLKEAKERSRLSDVAAEVLFYIEMEEEELKEKFQEEDLKDIVQDFGSYDAKQWGQMQQTFGEGRFDLQVEQSEDGHPTISMNVDMPEGNVAEKVQLNQSLQDALITKAKEETEGSGEDSYALAA